MNQRGAPRARNELRARRCAIAVGGRPLNTALGCTVSLRRKVYTWIALVLSIPAALYAGMSVIFYAWLNAAEPERWPADRAGLWVSGSFALAVLFLGVFLYCAFSLWRGAKRGSNGDRAT